MSEFNKHLLGGKNELRNWSFEKLASDPSPGPDLYAGRFWLNTTSNEIKYYDGTTIQPVGSGGGGASQLSDLSDVNTSTPTNRNVLVADGVDWESRALTEADISDLGNYIDTTGTPANNQIAIFTDADTVEGDANFVWDGFRLDIFDLRLGESTVTNYRNVIARNLQGLRLSNSGEGIIFDLASNTPLLVQESTVLGLEFKTDGSKGLYGYDDDGTTVAFQLQTRLASGDSAKHSWIKSPSGRVGIGLENPNETLDVAGSVSAGRIVIDNTYGFGNHTTIVGSSTVGDSITTGTKNTLIGSQAGDSLTTGNDNIAIGFLALSESTTSSGTTAVGNNAMRFSSGALNNNTVYGFSALEGDGTDNLTGAAANVVMGYDALELGGSVATRNNVVIGYQALDTKGTTFTNNVAIGHSAAGVATYMEDSNVIGQAAGDTALTLIRSELLGQDCLPFIDGTIQNTVAIGNESGRKDGTNTVNVTGDVFNCVLLGTQVKLANPTVSNTNQITIGWNAISEGDNTTKIGNTLITDTYIEGVLHPADNVEMVDGTTIGVAGGETINIGRTSGVTSSIVEFNSGVSNVLFNNTGVIDSAANIQAPAFVTDGGTASDFVKGDGSLDSTVYLDTVDLGYTASTRTVTNTGGTDAVIPEVTSTDAGLAPASGGGTTNFLRADGTWAAPAGGGSAPTLSKSIGIISPTSSEDVTMFFTPVAITVSEMRAIVQGTTPSVSWTIKHSTDRSAAGNAVVTAGTTTTSTTTGSDVTSFDDATIPADSFIWLETTAATGTIDDFNVTIIYTED